MADDLIIHNIGKLYTFPGEGPVPGRKMDSPRIIENGAVTASDGKITHVGTGDEVWPGADLKENAKCIDAQGMCLLPGFVDPHTHVVFAGSREFEISMKLKGASYLDILNAGGGILRTMEETRKATTEDLITQMDRRLDKMMRYGTTTAEVKSGYGLDPDAEMKMLRAVKGSNHPLERIPTFLGPHAIPPEYKGRPDDFLDLMIETIPGIVKEDLALFADIFCEKNVFDADQSRRFLEAAKKEGLRPKIHSDEIENLGGTTVGAKLGAASADHLLVTNEADMKAMLDAGTVPVLLPGTLMTIFEKRVPQARKMMEIGLPVSIATDINPNCWVENIQFIQTLSCYRLGMTPNEILAATTVNAAHATGVSDRKGRIEPGYDADMLILKSPSFDHVVYNFGVNHVDTVVKNGHVAIDKVGW